MTQFAESLVQFDDDSGLCQSNLDVVICEIDLEGKSALHIQITI